MHMTDLESLVDHRGLVAVLRGLSEICNVKAEHVLSSYQDDVLAQSWVLAAREIEETAASIESQTGLVYPPLSPVPLKGNDCDHHPQPP